MHVIPPTHPSTPSTPFRGHRLHPITHTKATDQMKRVSPSSWPVATRRARRRSPSKPRSHQWVITDAVCRAVGLRSVGGRPVSSKRPWALVERLPAGRLGAQRPRPSPPRMVRPRSGHVTVDVHPGAMAGLLDEGVLGGRDAAASGLPLEVGTVHRCIPPRRRASQLSKAVGARPARDGAKRVRSQVVDRPWPIAEGHWAAGPWVGWPDLTNRKDRAADAVLDQVVGGWFRWVR